MSIYGYPPNFGYAGAANITPYGATATGSFEPVATPPLTRAEQLGGEVHELRAEKSGSGWGSLIGAVAAGALGLALAPTGLGVVGLALGAAAGGLLGRWLGGTGAKYKAVHDDVHGDGKVNGVATHAATQRSIPVPSFPWGGYGYGIPPYYY